MIQDFLDEEVLEGISVVRFKDKEVDFDGIKIDDNLLLEEVDDEFVLEKVIEVEATDYDTGDVFYEEIAIRSSVEELLPFIKDAIEDSAEERGFEAFMNYENDIVDEEDEDDF